MLYTSIFIFLLICVFWYDLRNQVTGKTICYFISFLLIVGMSSFRHRVGGDALFYEDYYPEMPGLTEVPYFIRYQNFQLFMPLWIIINAITKSLSNNIVFFQILHALIFNTLLFIFIKKYSSKPFSVLLIFFTSLLCFYYSFEIQREAIAVGIFLLNIKNLEKKDWFRYYLLATVSFLFHISSIILFVLPLFKLVKFNRKLVVGMVLGSVFIAIFKKNILDFFTFFLFLDSMKNKAALYLEINFSITGFIAFYIVRVILFLPVALYLCTEKRENQKYQWFYSAFFTFSLLAQFFVGFDRFLNYLYPVYLVIVIDFLYNYFPKIKSLILKSLIVLTMFLHLFFIIEYKLFVTNIYGEHYYTLFFPYNSILDPHINKERESFYANQWLLQ